MINVSILKRPSFKKREELETFQHILYMLLYWEAAKAAEFLTSLNFCYKSSDILSQD